MLPLATRTYGALRHDVVSRARARKRRYLCGAAVQRARLSALDAMSLMTNMLPPLLISPPAFSACMLRHQRTF